MISLQLPYPPSVNHYWGVSGKQRFIGKKGKEFRQAVAEACLDAQIQTMDGRLAVHVAIWPPDNRKRDVDNTLKPLLDAMEHAGVYENDSQIDELHIIRRETMKGGSCSVVIVPIQSA
jgi:crossover junction endodeoxyribonuclease RusA